MNNYNNLDTSKLKYVIYCRKSSEGEDKQVQSLDTQIRELKEHAERNNLEIIKVISESKSAFKIGREGFDEMMCLIKSGKANAILVIRANRISRNPVDAGHVISLMDDKKLLYIRTPNSTCYTSSSTDKMMIAIELIFSKKDSDDKGDMVKEGQKTKALKGIPHGVASLGFLNDKTEEKGNRKWIVDEVRLSQIKILLDMFLTGTYSAGKLYKYAIEVLKLTTVPRKRCGGALITWSRIYEILKDPIYAGFFSYGGQRYELDIGLPRLITEDQHNKIKIILARNNIPKFKEHKTTFSGFLTSDEGNFIGQDVKYQLICDCKKKFSYLNRTHCPSCNAEINKLKNPRYLDYTFYYNVKKKKTGEPYKAISEKDIVEKLGEYIDLNLTFSEELASWSRQYLEELKLKELNDVIFKKKLAENNRVEFEKKKIRLREMLRDNQITDDEYRADVEGLQRQYAQSDDAGNVDWYSRMNEIVDLTLCMKKVLENGTIQQKRNILSQLGSNLVWNDKELSITNDIAIEKLVEGIKRAKEINPEFEPKNCVVYKAPNEKTDEFSSVFSTMLPR
ncbi:MAG: recombinase family protein [Candidatus Pacebacteria bacterium]|nr:recombinase family protein [Candidatus Paceibacterota bacterium]